MKRICLNATCVKRGLKVNAERAYCLTCERELDHYPVTLGDLFNQETPR